MPTPAFSAKVISFNRQNGIGKHRTAAEIKAREDAAKKMTRKEVKLKIPAFLKTRACAPALKIWKELVKEGMEINLFDNVDSRVLADFCRYQALLEEELERSSYMVAVFFKPVENPVSTCFIKNIRKFFRPLTFQIIKMALAG